eukprot:m.832029 g.832029  ORF g.832029 m.832029 type:complete len:91 (+) comp59456_c0_seq61:579-851(+)
MQDERTQLHKARIEYDAAKHRLKSAKTQDRIDEATEPCNEAKRAFDAQLLTTRLLVEGLIKINVFSPFHSSLQSDANKKLFSPIPFGWVT